MPDIVDAATRSRMMASIRGRDTLPEMRVRRALHRAGFRFRLHARALPGRPDLVLRKHRAVILVHGCFWHRHVGCRTASTPSANAGFWQAKFSANVARDARNRQALMDAGWRIAIVWECTLRPRLAGATIETLSDWLRSAVPFVEIPPAVPGSTHPARLSYPDADTSPVPLRRVAETSGPG